MNPRQEVPSESEESEEENPLASPRRPHQSVNASPAALLQPDPPTVEETLAGASRELRQTEQRQLRQQRQEQPAAMPNVNYDQQNLDDDEGAYQNARDCKLPFNKHDVKLWFSLVESKMQFAGLKKQWSKRQVLVQLIPPELHNDFKHYLQLQETEAGNNAYYTLKQAILKQFGVKQADNFDKAISRVMTSTPSHLGRQILNDICPATKPLHGCHCANVVLGIWRRSLPVAVRNAIADMPFDNANYVNVFDKADAVWSSNAASTSVVAQLNKSTSSNQEAEVAAVSRKPRRGNRGGGRGNGGGGGSQGQSGNQQNSKPQGQGQGKGRGPRHPDGPPNNACSVHWKFGKAAWLCADRHNCPWRDFENPRPRHNRNIAATEMKDNDSD